MKSVSKRQNKPGAPDAGVKISSRLSSQDGLALLMVLFVVTVLTTMVVSFTDTTQKHLHLTRHYKNRLQAYWSAQSGIQAVDAGAMAGW